VTCSRTGLAPADGQDHGADPAPEHPGDPVRRAHCAPWERTITISLPGNARRRPLNNLPGIL